MATAREYLPAALSRALGDDVPVYEVRIPDDGVKDGVAAIWTQTGERRSMLTDGGVPVDQQFEAEFRASRPEYARKMADDFVREIEGRSYVENRYDEPDDGEQQKMGVFCHIVVFRLMAQGLPDGTA